MQCVLSFALGTSLRPRDGGPSLPSTIPSTPAPSGAPTAGPCGRGFAVCPAQAPSVGSAGLRTEVWPSQLRSPCRAVTDTNVALIASFKAQTCGGSLIVPDPSRNRAIGALSVAWKSLVRSVSSHFGENALLDPPVIIIILISVPSKSCRKKTSAVAISDGGTWERVVALGQESKAS